MIDYENYYVFNYTDKQLKKKYTSDILAKYYKPLAYLYQNGYDVNATTVEDIDDEFSWHNGFLNYEDFEELPKPTVFDTGKEIIKEELYDIVKRSSFIQEECSPVVIKIKYSSNKDFILSTVERINRIFNSKDAEIAGNYSSIENIGNIRNKISELEEKIEKDMVVQTWIKFKDLIRIIYALYINLSRVKTDTHKLALASNINNELYGALGGYNPNTKEVQCSWGGAAYDVKEYYNLDAKKETIKLRMMANTILKDSEPSENDEPEIKFLEQWVKANSPADNEKAKRIIVNCLLNGCKFILCLKHNLTLVEDRKNDEKETLIKDELKSIIKFAGVPYDYLL